MPDNVSLPLSVDDMKAVAKERGLEGYSSLDRNGLIELLGGHASTEVTTERPGEPEVIREAFIPIQVTQVAQSVENQAQQVAQFAQELAGQARRLAAASRGEDTTE